MDTHLQKGEQESEQQSTEQGTTELRDVALGKNVVRTLVTGEQTEKRYAMTEITLGPGAGLGPHRHLYFDEMNVIVEGALRGKVGEESFRIGPGEMIRIPKGVLHSTENDSMEKPVVSIVIYTPAGIEGYFQRLAYGLEDGQLAHGGRKALQEEYGVVFEGPYFTQRKQEK